MIYDIIIIGAGISGLTAAVKLREAGKSCLVLEKSRGLGGRMATRRRDDAVFDHGAQYLTAKSEEFSSLVENAKAQGILREWFTSDSGNTRYCGSSGMTSLPKFIAGDLEIRRQTKVIRLDRSADTWTVQTDSGDNFMARKLLLTAPLPQSIELLDTSGIPISSEDDTILRRVEYTKCLAFMLLLNQPVEISQSGYLESGQDGPVKVIADNFTKGVSDTPAITIHMSPDFSRENYELPPADAFEKLQEHFDDRIVRTLVSWNSHRWGYALCLNPIPARSYTISNLGLHFCGDSFFASKIEGAYLSGSNVAEHIQMT